MVGMQELEEVFPSKSLSSGDLEQLARVVDKRKYPKGDIIFQQQQPANHFYLIKKGVVKLGRITSNESQNVNNVLGVGAYLGDFSLSRKASYFDTAQALADSELLAFNRSEFNLMSEHSCSCGLKVVKDITSYLGHLLQEMSERYIDALDFMISGKFYRSRHQISVANIIPLTSQDEGKQIKITEQELCEIPLFADFSHEERERVAKIMTARDYQIGEFVFEEYAQDDKLYIIQEGMIKISKAVQLNRSTSLSILKKGNFLDALAMLEETKHNMTAQAVKNSRVLIMERSAFEDLMGEDPRSALKITGHICKEVYEMLNEVKQNFNYMYNYVYVWETEPFYSVIQ